MIDFDEIREDIEAFADDDEDVILDRAGGQCMFMRHGREVAFKFVPTADERLFVEINGTKIAYRDFLARELAQLDTFAERIVAKRQPPSVFVDGRGRLDRASAESEDGTALELLDSECSNPSVFVPRVLFVTADAGQGKTALLKQFQHSKAEQFLEGKSPYLFWHVDLQGRQLLRLSEALMGDLGDLRISGLWMPAITRLMRHGLLVLGIDGFDELAAEQGSNDALGALAAIVQQLEDRGTIVAASRRTFFDTDDYVQRSSLFSRHSSGECQFDQLSLAAWNKDEGIEYLSKAEEEGKTFSSPEETYEEIAAELGEADHTMITRPFLLAQMARAILLLDLKPADFIRGIDDPLKGVGAVIEAFVDREVSSKWKQRETGEPFLSPEQHMELLSNVAEEMYRSQRAALSIDVIQTIAQMLFDEWDIAAVRRQELFEMIKMHVLLTRPDGDDSLRGFDHEEFLAWFTAYALKTEVLAFGDRAQTPSTELLSIAQLTEATAAYVCALIERDFTSVTDMLDGLISAVKREAKPTYFAVNVGTLVPRLVDGISGPSPLEVDGPIVFTSLVMERTNFESVNFKGCSFVNISIDERASWSNVTFDTCKLGEVTVDRRADLDNVRVLNSSIDGLHLVGDGEPERREYAPERIVRTGRSLGVIVESTDPTLNKAGLSDAPSTNESRRIAQKLLSVFRRTTFASESLIQLKLGGDAQFALDELIPTMERFGVIRAKQWRGSGKQQNAWGPAASIDRVEHGDGNETSPFFDFWKAVDQIQDPK